MLKFYYSGAPNPTKVALFLEEAEIPYEALPVDTRRGEQHKPEFVAINPNAKLPAIDNDQKAATPKDAERLVSIISAATRVARMMTPLHCGATFPQFWSGRSGFARASSRMRPGRSAGLPKLPELLRGTKPTSTPLEKA